MAIHIHIQKVTPSSHSLSGSPHIPVGRGGSSVLDSSANHNLPHLAPFLGASATVARLPELHMPALQMPRMEMSSGEAIVQLDLQWNLLMAGGTNTSAVSEHLLIQYVMQLLVSLHLVISQLMIQMNRGHRTGLVLRRQEGDGLLDIKHLRRHSASSMKVWGWLGGMERLFSGSSEIEI